MHEISLLDCTLRDGGYINDWKFGHINLVSIFERLVDAGTDVIEIGFLDERRPFDIDRSIFPDTKSADAIFGTLDKKNTAVVAMIDYGTCDIHALQPCEDTFIDGIRVIFKKHLMREALAFCGEVKKLGYKVFAQLVSVTSYSDTEFREMIGVVNEVKPYAVSMVDTYGLLHPEDLIRYYKMLDQNLDEEVCIGFHAHNNFQLAYANALTFISQPTRHNRVVDGTLYGMGKSAGNAPLELLAMRLNDRYDGHYRIDAMLDAIEESVLDFYQDSAWGYKEFFYLCAKNRCHPNYVTYYSKKKNLSNAKIDQILGTIEPEDKKLMYDSHVAEKYYQEYIQDNFNDGSELQRLLTDIAGRPLLLVGPGKNIQLQLEKVDRFIRENHPFVMSINYLPSGIRTDCVFVTNNRRYHDMTLSARDYDSVKTIATTNVECRNGSFDYVVQRAPLLDTAQDIIDNSFLMAIKLLSGAGIQKIYCAGFDGYSDKDDNYCNPSMEYDFVKNEASRLNKHMKETVAMFRESLEIEFITYSAYDYEEDIQRASI